MNEKLDFKFTAITILLLIVMLPFFSLAHELGHVFMCYMDGREYNFSWNWTSCSGKFDDPTMYRMMGGFVSTGLAMIIFASIKDKAVGKYKPIAIVLVTIGVIEFVNMVLETFLHDFYMDFGSAVSGMLMLGLTIFFVFRHSPRIRRLEV